jgi:hypothetical protein
MTHRRALGAWAAVLTIGGLTALPNGRAAEPTEIEARLESLEDYVRIEQLLMRYAAALNTRDADTGGGHRHEHAVGP